MSGSKPEEYERVCARCWEEEPGEGWFRVTFPMLIGLTERRVYSRSLCPGCGAAFEDDAARTAFLATTLPARFIRLPAE